jgi:hypothetical protein
LRGDTEVHFDAQEQQVWEVIKKEWPILMGADTLLNFQAMLRLLVLLFVAIRAEASGKSPLTGMAALLGLAAALARGSLNAGTSAYRLEGPLSLGGDLPIACELASVPFLAALGFGGLRKAPVKAVMAVSGAIWFASHHFLNLAKDTNMDRLFIQAHVLELLAAFAYAARACSLMVGQSEGSGKEGIGHQVVEKSSWRGSVFVGFMHMLMTFQQALSAYYFLTAFEPSPGLVGQGRPFCILCVGNLLSLGAYLCAAAFWAGGAVDIDWQLDSVELAGDVLRLPTATELQEDVGDVCEVQAATEVQEGGVEDSMVTSTQIDTDEQDEAPGTTQEDASVEAQ